MRNRQNYQSDILMVTDPTDSSFGQVSDALIINRVQGGTFGFSIKKADVNQFGKLGKVTSQVVSAPQVSATFTYYLSFEDNEEKLGFNVGSDPLASFSEGMLSTNPNKNTKSDAVRYGKNFFIITSPEGEDANRIDDGLKEDNEVSVLTLGGSYIDRYSAQGSIGSIPTATFSVVGSQLQVSPETIPADKVAEPNISVANPFVNQNSSSIAENFINISNTGDIDGRENTISALRPGDLTILAVRRDGSTLGVSEDAHEFLVSHIQNFSLDIPISRTPIRKLGRLYDFSKDIDFPIEVSLSFSAIVSDLEEESLYDEIFNDLDELDFWILWKSKNGEIRLFDENGNQLLTESGEIITAEGDSAEIIVGNPSTIDGAVGYVVRGCELVTKAYSAQIGSNKTIEFQYSSQIGGSNDVRNGVAFINT